MKRYMFGFITICLFSVGSIVFANCPDPSQVVYKCINVNGEPRCSWSADWWEGYDENDPLIKEGERATTFIRVRWHPKGIMPLPNFIGSTQCFYQSRTHKEIMLSQNYWGHVPIPTQGNWCYADSNGKTCIPNSKNVNEYSQQAPGNGTLCFASVTNCDFQYP